MVPENDPESTFGVYKEKLIGKVKKQNVFRLGFDVKDP